MNNSVELIHIRDQSHPAVPTLQKLYEAAFPVEERRDSQQLLGLLHQQDMFVYAVTAADEAMGLCIYWQLEGFYFLEHLAIAPSHQDLGLGRQVMQWLLRKTNRKLLLEVERPTDKISRKRIRFYQKLLGFTLHDTFNYHQPPYQQEGKSVPLYLMSAEAIADTAELLRIASHIKQQVYERFYF
ncbi:GNAT family N-acetyltransferase [Pontibacter brevis]